MKLSKLFGNPVLTLVAIVTAANPSAPIASLRAQVMSHAGASPASFRPASIDMPTSRVDVPMQLLPGSRPVVRAMVNGQGPFNFAIETGAPMVVITEATAVAAHLTKQTEAADAAHHWAGGEVPRRLTIDSLRIGDVVFRGQSARALTSPSSGRDTRVE